MHFQMPPKPRTYLAKMRFLRSTFFLFLRKNSFKSPFLPTHSFLSKLSLNAYICPSNFVPYQKSLSICSTFFPLSSAPPLSSLPFNRETLSYPFLQNRETLSYPFFLPSAPYTFIVDSWLMTFTLDLLLLPPGLQHHQHSSLPIKHAAMSSSLTTSFSALISSRILSWTP